MKFAIRTAICFAVAIAMTAPALTGEEAYVQILKTEINANGFQQAAKLYRNPDEVWQ